MTSRRRSRTASPSRTPRGRRKPHGSRNAKTTKRKKNPPSVEFLGYSPRTNESSARDSGVGERVVDGHPLHHPRWLQPHSVHDQVLAGTPDQQHSFRFGRAAATAR